jgi:hypothetical protein
MSVPLTELEAVFLKIVDANTMQAVDRIEDADGVRFACPKCYVDAGRSLEGVHGILCWSPKVGLEIPPGPGRWSMQGTGLGDLTLVAGSSSVQVTSGCMWHGFVRNGMALTI